jgi:hypothetical protein
MKKVLIFFSLIFSEILIAQNAPVIIQNITVPTPAPDNAAMTYRNARIKMQFSAQNPGLFYIKKNVLEQENNDDITFYNVNEKKHIGTTTIESLINTNHGREVLIDFYNGNIELGNDIYGHGLAGRMKVDAFLDATHQFVFNNNQPVRLTDKNAIAISIINYQNQTTVQSFGEFRIWKNPNSQNEFIKSEKEKYLDYVKQYSPKDLKFIKNNYDKKLNESMYYLEGITKTYDSIRQIAHIVLKFNINNLYGPYFNNYYSTYNILYEIDFKHKSYTELASSYYPMNLKGNFCSWIPIDNKPITNETIYDRPIKSILYFDEYSTTVFDSAYINKLNQLTTPAGDVKFEHANNLYFIFKEKAPGSRYYFVNRQNNICEKIINLLPPTRCSEMVWDDNLLKSAMLKYNNLHYCENSPSKNYATTVYIIDWNTLSADILDDHTNQQVYENRTNAYLAKAESDRDAFYKSLDEQHVRDQKSRQEMENIENTINKNYEKAKALKQLPLFPTKVTHYYWGADGQKHIID